MKTSTKAITTIVLLSMLTGMSSTSEAAVLKSCTIHVKHSGGLYKINDIPIANKQYAMSRNYNPGADTHMIHAYNKMKKAALKKGVYLDIVGAYGAYGFRSYDTQAYLYNSYINSYGYDYASKISARPGTSEHQLGLAMDIRDGSNNGTFTTAFEYTAASNYIKNNGYRYGFIVRYLKGKENITGFMYEPWHLRYVGITHAERIYKHHVTLEEYLGIAGRKKLAAGDYKVKGLVCQ